MKKTYLLPTSVKKSTCCHIVTSVNMKSSRFQAYMSRARTTNFDRHCQVCGVLIKGSAHQKPLACFKCKAPQNGRQGWMECGWGRCADCDYWLHKDHSYCMCGFANHEAIERRHRQQEAARQQEEHRRVMEVRPLPQNVKFRIVAKPPSSPKPRRKPPLKKDGLPRSETQFRCGFCGILHPTTYAKARCPCHGKFPCSICGKLYGRKDTLVLHLKEHEKN